MTFFDSIKLSEINEPGWNFETLKPPLKIREVLKDFESQWLLYSKGNLPFIFRIKFLLLRIVQRTAYNLGWFQSTRKNL